MDKPTTAAEAIQSLPAAFHPERAGNIKATIQFDLTGDGGGTWTLDIADGKAEVKEGPAAAPNATVMALAADWLAISRNELNPISAFMGGRLRVMGDMTLMMRFQDWFALPPA